MKRKAIYQQILVALGVLLVFIIGLTIGKLTSPTQSNSQNAKQSSIVKWNLEKTTGTLVQQEVIAF